MNSSLLLRVQGGMKFTNNQQPPTQKASILKFLRIVTGDTNLASDLSQVWVLQEFHLGNSQQANLHNKLAELHILTTNLPLVNNSQVRPNNAKLLILDTQPEYQFQQNLASVNQECTTSIISYRLSSANYTNCNLVRDRCILA